MPTRDPFIAEGLDVAWIIELWRALHGRDSDSQTVAVEAMAALCHYLECSSRALPEQHYDSQIC